jgi:translocation and assembly module TamB
LSAVENAAASTPAAPRRRWRLALWVLAGVLALLLAVAGGGAWWLWHSPSALSQLAAHVPGLSLSGQQGRPTGGPFALQRLQWQGGGRRIVVENLAWDDAAWQWNPQPGVLLGLRLERARAARVLVISEPAPKPAAAPSPPPDSLRLPIALQAAGLRIGSLLIDEQPAISDIGADVQLGAAGGTEHRIEQLSLRRDGLTLTGQVVLGSGTGLPLQAALRLSPQAPETTAEPAWQLALQAQGPIQRLAITAKLQHLAGASADAQATVAPFAAWPLLALAAQAEALDLSTLGAGLPQTRLSGKATLSEPSATHTSTDPLRLELRLQNDSPGPWDAARLPLRSLQLLLQGNVAEPGTLVVETLQAVLSGQQDTGTRNGTVSGSGRLAAGQLELQLLLDGVRPELLHTRAPAMALAGKLTAKVSGLPDPTAKPAAARTLQGELQLDLNGRLPRKDAPPLTLKTAAAFTLPPDGTLQASLRDLQASAGDASQSGKASAKASVLRNVAGDWQVQSTGELQRFDPGPWWPAANLSRGGQAINARWDADITQLAATVASLQQLRGRADITLADSRFANLVWQGQASLRAAADALQGKAELQAGSNRFQIDGRLRHTSARTSGREAPLPSGVLDINAPALSALAPLAALLPASAAAWWPRDGTLSAHATAQGRWPALRSEGTLRASKLRSASLALEQADATWNLSTEGAEAPMSLQLQASGIATGAPGKQQRVDSLDVALQGSLREHSLQVRASSPLRPPAWAEAVAGNAAIATGGSSLQLQGSGRWQPAAGGGGTWQGRIAQLQAASRGGPGTGSSTGAGTPWLSSENLQASVVLNADGQPLRAELQPGRVAAFGGALAWQQALWQAPAAAGGAARIALQAQLEPLQVAPLLLRLQPQFGWRGDLALGGSITVRSGERFDADISIARSGGDLSLTVEGATRALDISDLRVGLAAHDGQWQLTQALVGRSVGVVGGLQTIRSSPQALVPDAADPLEGGLSLIVPQLQVWAPWLPPGWRLGGNLRIAASFGGRVAAPEYRGEVTGEGLSVRNLFEGIHLEQGALALALNGTQASIQRFEFRDGAGADGKDGGVLRVSGSGSIDEPRSASLRIETAKLRLLDRYDRRISASGNADVEVRGLQVAARGAFSIDEGLVDATQADAPSLSSDVVVINRAPLGTAPGAPVAPPKLAGPTALPPANSARASADVDLRVDLGQALRLRGRGLDTLLRGQLRVTTPGGQLAVNGVVRAEEGTYRAYGQNLRIERGNLIFRGEVATPQLDILALRADIDQRVGVVVSGSPVNPRVRLYSEPELGQLDTLTWLVLGRAPEGLGRDDTALLQRAALALLAGDRGNNQGFLQKIGLDELSLSRANTGGVNDTVISLGKQISKRVYVGYEHALGAAGGTLQLIYRIANRITLRARTGSENALDAIWTWRWD